jgi:ribosomal protein L11 methyltransferase
MEGVLAQLPEHLRQADRYRVEILEDRDWERAWMEHYRPMQFGRRLWVCPGWLGPPEPGAVNLLLDPGLAFGTGTHPTTALCLEQLDGLALAGRTVVDYGCGSGILALAALKLGAAMALGVDTDPQALSASRENARRNAIATQDLELVPPRDIDSRRWEHVAHVVIANILAGPLVELSDRLLQLLRPGGTLLLSGLLESQSTALCDHYADRIRLHVAGERDSWVCLRGIFS